MRASTDVSRPKSHQSLVSRGEGRAVPRPVVSICIPTYNGGALVADAVESALSQTYAAIEVIVVDDASTDGSAQRVRMRFGSRIVVLRNRRNRGQAVSTNLAVARARGEFVKFLHHDDRLNADCVARMVDASSQSSSVVFVFSRRKVEVAQAAHRGPDWLAEFSNPHLRIPGLSDVNRGSDLVDVLVHSGLRANHLGEPTAVMVSRGAFIAAGGMSSRPKQFADLDVWLRVLLRGDAVFVDDELSTYRVAADSTTGRNGRERRGWMDRLWIAENLLRDPRAHLWREELLAIRDEERAIAWKTALRGALRLQENAGHPAEWLEYAMWRLESLLRRTDAGMR